MVVTVVILVVVFVIDVVVLCKEHLDKKPMKIILSGTGGGGGGEGYTFSCLIVNYVCQRFGVCFFHNVEFRYFKSGDHVIWYYESRKENT